MAGLFDDQSAEHLAAARPLADRMRPASLDEFAGQAHVIGTETEPGPLRAVFRARRFTSLIFYGPPGTGKTTLAKLVSAAADAEMVSLNAAAAGVKELREVLAAARDRLKTGGVRTVLFVDELHHFNRTQQDVLLPDIESGIVMFVGATTSNPFFALASALVSRSQIFEFRPVPAEAVVAVLERALADDSRGLGGADVGTTPDALRLLADAADGDVRRGLSALEVAVGSLSAGETLTAERAAAAAQKKALLYDNADTHYDVISAYIKSLRGSDPDAAVYWLARMLEAGEDPRFIARRLVIAAAEDVGNADPQALVVAEAAAAATDRVGLPECRIPLAQGTVYVSMAPKSNAAYAAINAAMEDVRSRPLLPVPPHLRDKHAPGVQAMGEEARYLYPHDYPGAWVDQDYLPEPRRFYEPTGRGVEAGHARRLSELRGVETR